MKRLVLAQMLAFALLAGTARAEGPVLGFSVGSGGSAATSLPSAAKPNQPGEIAVPAGFTSPPAVEQQLPLSSLQTLWRAAGAAYGVPWNVLASINKIESNFGQNMGPSSAGAVGWMQFMPSTWLRWGFDADANGFADPWSAADAIYSAARYLAASGGQTDIARGVFAYNHADWYVNEVLALANVYGQGGAQETADLQLLQAKLETARLRVVAVNRRLVVARARADKLSSVARRMGAKAEGLASFSGRLAATRLAVQAGARAYEAEALAGEAQSALDEARTALAAAEQSAQAPSFAPGAASLLSAPSFQNGYVFPVGGGPQFVSVSHTHHDYPAADIAAPAGSPVYALGNVFVVRAWSVSEGSCGIGATFRTMDGLEWTYCHLSYLQPTVQAGAQLQAGAPVGLVGSTGHSTGPHLHLQLQPATDYPQDAPWFQHFAGSAFQWQDAPTPAAVTQVSPRVFSVVPDSADPVIAFSR